MRSLLSGLLQGAADLQLPSRAGGWQEQPELSGPSGSLTSGDNPSFSTLIYSSKREIPNFHIGALNAISWPTELIRNVWLVCRWVCGIAGQLPRECCIERVCWASGAGGPNAYREGLFSRKTVPFPGTIFSADVSSRPEQSPFPWQACSIILWINI